MWPVVKLVLELVMQLVTYTFSHPWITHGQRKDALLVNKAGYMATQVACGWAGAVLEKLIRAFGQEQ